MIVSHRPSMVRNWKCPVQDGQRNSIKMRITAQALPPTYYAGKNNFSTR